jgi:glycosyltransferase involved in cell wall biosynthesis
MEPILIGVDPHRFEAVDDQRVRKQLDIGARPFVLSLGHVIPVRNRVTLVHALPALLDRYPDAAVVIVGDVHDETFIHEARRLGVEQSLIITGAVSKDEIPFYVAGADLETHDHQGRGLGTTTLEVMAAGKPVIVAAERDNFPGLELIDGENTLTIDHEDHEALAKAMIALLDDPELGARIGAAQRELILEHFTMPRVAAAHVHLFGRLLSTPQEHRAVADRT